MILPLLGNIRCGYPSPAQGYEDEPLNLHDMLVRHPAATFFYRVRGDELRPEGIRDSSILVVDRSIAATPGRLVVGDLDGERIVTRLDRTNADRLIVWGVVTAAVVRY